MTAVRHSDDPICTSCEMKLLSARPELGEYFRAVKLKYPDVHISWSYRNKEDQELAFTQHKTHAHYPFSKHNKTENGKPCSHAIDLFQINAENPKGKWDEHFCEQVYNDFQPLFPIVTWGGKFKSLSDKDHFQIEVDESTGSVMLPDLT